MTSEEAFKQLEAAMTTFEDLGNARKKLVGQELTYELFDQINGADHGLEALLNREITFLDFENPGQVAKLKQDIFAAIEAEEITVGKAAHAALECYCEDLVRVCSDYDAYSNENIALRAKLVEKIKAIGKNGVEAFKTLKLDFECFSYTNCLEIINLTKELTEFFETDTFNLPRLEELQSKQGIDMTDEDKEFLQTLQKVCHDQLSEPGWKKFDVLWGDRLTGATIEALGFDPKNTTELCKLVNKTQEKLMKTIRKIREALCKETSTTDDVTVKNTTFWNAISRLMWYIQDIAHLNKDLDKQLALTSKACETLEDAPAKTDDNIGNPPDDTDNPDDNNEPEPQE